MEKQSGQYSSQVDQRSIDALIRFAEKIEENAKDIPRLINALDFTGVCIYQKNNYEQISQSPIIFKMIDYVIHKVEDDQLKNKALNGNSEELKKELSNDKYIKKGKIDPKSVPLPLPQMMRTMPQKASGAQ
ncbi:MAG: hypothetical protein EZS28_038447 [Streblomastix strix]|uniref:Uncharacterized protein n=1 Tax=Streblomastix strix TaxID=222440 RepID=A0A5J4U5C2_9EUKA|nr:MAG: hypothetical protein EZS28_038447 [Streblomastix strix]